MKRYSVSFANHPCEYTPKEKIGFQYQGRTDNPEEIIESYKNSPYSFGLQITDSKTKEVVFSDKREVKGRLVITLTDGKKTWESKICFADLEYMRIQEHYYSFEYKNTVNKDVRVVKVKREIY